LSTTSEVTTLGYTIPVWDYLTAHEMEQVEILAAEKPESATRHDVRVLAVFIESRLGEKPNVDRLMKQPIRNDELAVAVEALTGPFFDAQRERIRRRYARLMGSMTREDIQSQIDTLKAALEEQEKHANAGMN
jgi:hypothetical protein